MEFIFAQILSGFSTLMMVVALFKKRKKIILIFNSFASVFTIFAYLLLQRYAGMFLVIGGFLRSMLFAFYEKDNKLVKSLVSAVFTAYFIAFFAIYYKDASDIICLVNYVMMTFAFAFANVKVLKVFYMISAVLLIIYNFFVLAYVEVIKFVVQLISAIIGFVIIVKEEKQHNLKISSETNTLVDETIKQV